MSHYPHGHPPRPPPPPGGFTYVPTPVMMPVYQPPPPPPPPEPAPPPTIITNHIYHQPPPPPPPPVTIVEEIRIQPQPSHPWDNILSTAEKGLATVEKGLSLLETRKQGRIERIRKINNPISWVPSTGSEVGTLRHRAFVAGREGWDGSPLCVIRAHHNGEFIPGKLAIKHQAAYIPHGGREVPVHNFEVLCASPNSVRWLPGTNGHVPVGAIPAGNTHTGEPLYIGRASHMNSVTPGKVHPSHGCCYISFSGSEVAHKSYEVLCRIVG